MITQENRDRVESLLSAPAFALDDKAKQLRFVVATLNIKSMCPFCSAEQSFFDAASPEYDPFADGVQSTKLADPHCMACGRELEVALVERGRTDMWQFVDRRAPAKRVGESWTPEVAK